MVKAKQSPNIAKEGISGTYTSKPTTKLPKGYTDEDDKVKDTFLARQSAYVQAAQKARANGATEAEAREAGRTAKYGEGGFEQRIQQNYRNNNGSVNQGNGNTYYTDPSENLLLNPAAKAYADRLQATQAQNAWEGTGINIESAQSAAQKFLDKADGNRFLNALGGWQNRQIADYVGAFGNIVGQIADWTGNERLADKAAQAQERSDVMRYIAESQTQASKEGLGKIGQTVVDVGQTLSDVAMDTATTVASFGLLPGLAAMGARAFGSAAAEKRMEGASIEEQNMSGLKSAAIEVLTEKIGGPFETAYGRSLLGDATEDALKKISKNAVGRFALSELGNFLSEGGEEVLSGILNPLADRVLKLDDGTGKWFDNIDWKETMYEGLLGGLTGALGGAVSVNTYRPDPMLQDYSGNSQQLIQAAKDNGKKSDQRLATRYGNRIGEDGSLTNRQAERLLSRKSVAQAYADAIQNENSQKKAEAEKNAAIQNFVKGTEAEGSDVTQTIDKDAVRSNYGGKERTVSMVRMDGQNLMKLTDTADDTEVSMTFDEVRENDALPDDVRIFASMLDSKLGENAPAAYEAYDGNMSTGEYAIAMHEAINLYAGNGADLTETVKKLNSGENVGSPVAKLNSAQISVAQSAGNKIYQQKKLDMNSLRTKYAYQAKAIRQARETSAADIRKIDASIAEVNGEIKKAGENLAEANRTLSGLQEGTEEYRQAQQQVTYWQNYITQAEEALNVLNSAKTEAQNKAPVKRARGTVSFAGDTTHNKMYEPVDRDNLTKAQKRAADAINALADLLPVDIVLYDNQEKTYVGKDGKTHHSNTFGEYYNGKIYVNINAGTGGMNVSIGTLAHELTHMIKESAPAEYQALEEEILKIYFNNEPASFHQRIKEYMGGEDGLSYEGAVEELIANSCTRMLRDSDAIRQVARDNMNLAQKILDTLDQIIAKVKEAYENITSALFEEEKFYDKYINEFEHARELWSEALSAARNNIDNGIKNTAPESGAKYSKYEEEEILHLKDQVRSNLEELNKMPVISEINTDYLFDENDIQGAVNWICQEIGAPRTVNRENFGKVDFTRKRINKGFNYLPGKRGSNVRQSIGQAFMEALAAAPDVVENGDLIEYHKNHKGYGYPTWTFAGPVRLNGKPGILAVVVKNTTGNYYDVHSIMTPDGDLMLLETKKAEASDGGALKNEFVAPSKLSADETIAEIEGIVKERTTGQFQKYVDGQISMDEMQAEDEYAARYIREGYHPTIAERLAEGDRIRDKLTRFFARLPDYEGKPTAEDIDNAIDVNPYSDAISGYMNSADELLNDIAYAVEWGFVPEKSKNTAFGIMEQMLNQMSTQLQVDWEATYHGKPKFREFAEWYEKRHGKGNSTYTVSEDMRNNGGVRRFQKFDVEEAAVNHFGTTNDYRIAGYILKDGRMLDFSGAHWLSGYDESYVSEWRKKNDIRQVDHEDIAEAYDEAGLNSTGDNRLKFINAGNIRLIPEAPGINLSQKEEPTDEQYERIKGFLNQNTYDRFYVDFEKDRENRLQYQGNINANRVVNDIKAYYRTGTAPQQSVVSQFHSQYQKFDSEYMDAENKNPTNNPDIRFQKWDSGAGDTAEESRERVRAQVRLEYENQLMHDTINSLNKELEKLQAKYDKQGLKSSEKISELKRELKLTKTPEVRKADAKKIAKAYIEKANSTADAEQITDMIVDLGNYIVQGTGETLDEGVIVKKAHDIAALLVEKAAVKDTSGMEAYQKLASDIKGRKFVLPEEDRVDLDIEGGYDRFRKKNFGRFMLVNEGGTPVRTAYAELQGAYGTSLLPDVRNQGDMIRIMADVFDLADPDEINPFSNAMAQAAAEFTNDIIYDVLGEELRQKAPTFADKAKAKQGALKAENKELSKELKAEAREANREKTRLEKALDKTERQLARVKAEKDAKIAELKEKGTARVQQARAKEKAAKWAKVKEVRDLYREREHTAAEKRKESAGISKYRKQVIEKANKLYELVTVNSDKKHVPKVLRAPLAEFLESINFDSKQKPSGGENTQADDKFGTKLQRLHNILSKQQEFLDGDGTKGIDLVGYVDISQESLEYLRIMSEGVTEALDTGREFTINTMTAEELKGLSRFLTGLTRAISNINTFLANEAFKDIGDVAGSDMRNMQKLGSAKSGVNRGVSKFLNWKNATPYYAMQRFGEGGKSIFRSLVKGWGKMAMNVKTIEEFTDKTYTRKEVNSWKNYVHEFTLSDGNKIKMTTAQIMELSMLLEREQAVKHIDHGGIRIGEISTNKDEVNDTKHYHLSSEDILNIIGKLSDRQLQVANELRTFMAEYGAKLGNEVSMARFGYEHYDEGPKYYPIVTDSNDRALNDKDVNKNSSMFRLLNQGSSKPLNPNASNALVVGDIFDTFADHMADMAKLNGLGLPVLDAIKWFNYKERTDLGDGQYDVESMMATIEDAFGSEALEYIRTLIKDINGVHESGERGGNLLGKFATAYKVSAVAANLRVALLQPTSYVRASFILKPQYLAGAFGMKNGYQEALKYSGTAQWKSMGYYDTNISRNMREQIEHDDNWKDRFVEGSMKLAELGDQLTWGRLWNASKLQTRAETGLTGEELNKKTADLFDEVIHATQVMDSTLTRSHIMRSSSDSNKMFTAFMAEPTVSYNLLLDAFSKYSLDVRKNGKANAFSRNAGTLMKAFSVYAASASFSAIVESFIDAVRDDDDEEFYKKFLQAFLGEEENAIKKFYDGNLGADLSFVGKIPYAKDFVSILQGFGGTSIMAVDTAQNIVNAVAIWDETIRLNKGTLDDATKTTYYGKMTRWGKVYKTLQGLSQLSGIPASAALRDVFAIWNNIAEYALDEPDWKITTYDANKLTGDSLAAYKQNAASTGMSEKEYSRILKNADSSGDRNGSVKQDELGYYLMAAEKSGELSSAQIYAIWASKEYKTSYQDWKAKHK